MATKARKKTDSIKETLLNQSRRFAFIQALRLLKNHLMLEAAADHGDDEDASPPTALSRRSWQQAIRVRPELSLAFPGTDIVSIEEIERDDDQAADTQMRYQITTAFLGLYGISSPLPTFYTEDLLDEAREDSSVSRDFIDIINTPLYTLFLQVWAKYRLGLRIVEEEDSDCLEQLFCLIGLGGPEFRKQFERPEGLLRYTGLFTQSPRSAMGLELLLRDALKEENLQIIACMKRKAAIPEDQRCRLGRGACRLGNDFYLGRQMEDRMGKFRIRIGPIQWATFQSFLPDTNRFEKLALLTNAYLDQPLEWELKVILAPEESRPAQLGVTGSSRLGWSTWLFSGAAYKHEVAAAFEAKSAEKR